MRGSGRELKKVRGFADFSRLPPEDTLHIPPDAAHGGVQVRRVPDPLLELGAL